MEQGCCERPLGLGIELACLLACMRTCGWVGVFEKILIAQTGQIHSASEDDFELLIFLPPPTECWDYRHVLPYSSFSAGDQTPGFPAARYTLPTEVYLQALKA